MAPAREAGLELACPAVRLAADWLARAEACVLRLAATSARREGGGSSSLSGAGGEFIGHRPYRRGDDPRLVDWSVTARLGQPWVRVLRREARERWAVLLDTSASMGVGPPGKLQRAAELAGTLALFGASRGAEVALLASDGSEFRMARRTARELRGLRAFLEARRAAGRTQALDLVARRPALRPATRLFLISDPFAWKPRELAALGARARAWHALQLLAPHELVPPAAPALDWRDPESPRALELELDGATRAAYARELAAELARWSAHARRHGGRHGVWSSALPFEAILRDAFGA